MLVVKQESQIVGYVLMTPTDKPQEYWVLSLAVDGQFRGVGICRLLMEQAIATLPEESKVFLTVDPNNKSACALYLSMGFVTTKEESDCFGSGEPRLVMPLTI